MSEGLNDSQPGIDTATKHASKSFMAAKQKPEPKKSKPQRSPAQEAAFKKMLAARSKSSKTTGKKSAKSKPSAGGSRQSEALSVGGAAPRKPKKKRTQTPAQRAAFEKMLAARGSSSKPSTKEVSKKTSKQTSTPCDSHFF